MALEPINSVMSLQQQTYNPAPKAVQPAESVDAMRSENTAATPMEDIAVVENASAKGNADYQDNKEDQQATPEQLKKAVEQMKKGQLENSEAVFGFHEETNRVTIKIVDKETKKVIKELPPEKRRCPGLRLWTSFPVRDEYRH